MKKKHLIKKLQLKKTQVSNFLKDNIVGGSRIQCNVPIDLSLLETCIPGCGLTENCSKYRTCNNVTLNNCTVNICGSEDCNPVGSGEPSCINFSC